MTMIKNKNTTTLIAAACLVGIVAGIWVWSPFDDMFEASSSSYYQARLAYIRGSDADRQAIRSVFSDHKITMHEYSKVVFPLYLRGVHTPEYPFPAQEQRKSKDQLRVELEAELQ